MLRCLAAAILSAGFVVAPAAADNCSPHCDYWHNYGPYDFSYISPGLVGYPRCDPQGNCSPYLTYVYPGHRRERVIVRSLAHPSQ
jgi:hypothetical protein